MTTVCKEFIVEAGVDQVWITDVLPHELGGFVETMMEQGVKAMQSALRR
jgi:hypothetical protein